MWVIKEDTRSLDYSSCRKILLLRGSRGLGFSVCLGFQGA